jgi:hypothetical protein
MGSETSKLACVFSSVKEGGREAATESVEFDWAQGLRRGLL